MRLSFFLLLLALSPACRPAGEKERAGTEKTAAQLTSLPSIPDSTMQLLWERCDYIDYLFYKLSFSVSQDQPRDIQLALQHISRSIPELKPACQPLGRLFFQKEGQTLLEAEVFFSPKCQYYIFYQNGEKRYANAMTPAGVQFYDRILSMVNQ